jgi:hypothetical protein
MIDYLLSNVPLKNFSQGDMEDLFLLGSSQVVGLYSK